MPKQFSQAEIAEATAELDKVRQNWLNRPGVTAVDVGYKIKDGQLTDELAIRVHVQRKLPPEALKEHDMFPKRLGRFSVDVIEASYGLESVE